MSRHTLQAIPASNVGGDAPPHSLPHDDFNKQVIPLLRDDGRVAHDAMGQKLGLSNVTVQSRVARTKAKARSAQRRH